MHHHRARIIGYGFTKPKVCAMRKISKERLTHAKEILLHQCSGKTYAAIADKSTLSFPLQTLYVLHERLVIFHYVYFGVAPVNRHVFVTVHDFGYLIHGTAK